MEYDGIPALDLIKVIEKLKSEVICLQKELETKRGIEKANFTRAFEILSDERAARDPEVLSWVIEELGIVDEASIENCNQLEIERLAKCVLIHNNCYTI